MERNRIGGPREPDPATEGDLKVIRFAISQAEQALGQAYLTLQRVCPSDDCAKALDALEKARQVIQRYHKTERA